MAFFTLESPQEMNPVDFIRHWNLTYEVSAHFLGVDPRTVGYWFGKRKTNPRRSVCLRAAELHEKWSKSGCPVSAGQVCH